MRCAEGYHLVINSENILSRVDEILGFLGENRKNWFKTHNFYLNPKTVKRRIYDIGREIKKAKEGEWKNRLVGRLQFYTNLKRKYDALSACEKERLLSKLRDQYPVILTFEGEGLELEPNPHLSIHELMGMEVMSRKPVPLYYLREIEVPLNKIPEIKKEISPRYKDQIKIVPLETGELERLERLAQEIF